MSEGVIVKNKVALVTGANRGIGKALVECLLERGAKKVYAAVRRLESAKPLVDASSADDSRVVAVLMDLNKPDTIHTAATTVATDVDIVINNAGILSHTNVLEETAVEHLQQEMEVNVYGFMHVAQAFAPVLKKNGGGALVQVNSTASLRSPVPSVSTYAATKQAAFSITQTLRVMLKEQGTLVVSVHPGPIKTDMIAGNDVLARLNPETSEACAKEILASLERGEFLCFPDPKSKSLGQAYKPFSKYVFEDGNTY